MESKKRKPKMEIRTLMRSLSWEASESLLSRGLTGLVLTALAALFLSA